MNATITFSALDISSFDDPSYYDEFVKQFQVAVGVNAGVAPSVVSVLNIRAGSVAVDFSLVFDTTAIGSSSAFIDTLKSNPGNIFSSTEWSDAGKVTSAQVTSWTYRSTAVPPTQQAVPTSSVSTSLITLPIIPPEDQDSVAQGDEDALLSWLIPLMIAVALSVTLAGVVLYVYFFNRGMWWSGMEKLASTLSQRQRASSLQIDLNVEDAYEADEPSPMSPFQVITDPKTPKTPASDKSKPFHMYQNPAYDRSLYENPAYGSGEQQGVPNNPGSMWSGYPRSKSREGLAAGISSYEMRSARRAESAAEGSRTRRMLREPGPSSGQRFSSLAERAERPEQTSRPRDALSRSAAPQSGLAAYTNPSYGHTEYTNPSYGETDYYNPEYQPESK